MPQHQRYIELDLLRTLAILGMIVYHTAFDLSQFYGWHIDVFSDGWKILQISTASLFLLLVGVTSSITKNRNIPKRFLRIGGAALLVTIATYIVDPSTYVRFGILHLIAVSALLMPLISWMRAWLIIPAIALLILGPTVASIPTHSHLLLIFGITYSGFTTVDYFPLIPWFGIILMGYVIGYILYMKTNLRWRENPLFQKTISYNLSPITFFGRHSLLLYLMHQPIIIGILSILLGRPNF